jgi:hypothetical protein
MAICAKCGCTIDPHYNVCTLCYSRPDIGIEADPKTSTVESKPSISAHSPVTLDKKKSGSIWLVIGIVFIALLAIAVLPNIKQDSSDTPNISKTITVADTFASGVYLQQFTDVQPPALNSSGQAVHLVNNPAAVDPTLNHLAIFLWQDKTEDDPYVESEWVCIDFAEKLHNNAEQNGIKAALVTMKFQNERIGHAINAFQTTDSGLVYIDCTGSGINQICPDNNDYKAYVEEGREYGVISIDNADSSAYSYYVAYKNNWQRYQSMLDDFNRDVESYNKSLNGRTVLPEVEYYRFKSWEAQIDQKKQALENWRTSNKLGSCYSDKSLGIVQYVRIYW